MAKPVADYTGLFDEVLGSDGKTNLRGGNKPRRSRTNSANTALITPAIPPPTYAVWRGAREAIVVNAAAALLVRRPNCAQARPDVHGRLFAVVIRPKVFSTSCSSAAVISWPLPPDLLLAAAFPNPGIAGCGLGCARAPARRACTGKRAANASASGLRRRTLLLARVALLAAADARDRLSDSRLARVVRLSGALSRRLGLAARRENRRGRLDAPHVVVARRARPPGSRSKWSGRGCSAAFRGTSSARRNTR